MKGSYKSQVKPGRNSDPDRRQLLTTKHTNQIYLFVGLQTQPLYLHIKMRFSPILCALFAPLGAFGLGQINLWVSSWKFFSFRGSPFNYSQNLFTPSATTTTIVRSMLGLRFQTEMWPSADLLAPGACCGSSAMIVPIPAVCLFLEPPRSKSPFLFPWWRDYGGSSGKSFANQWLSEDRAPEVL